MKHTQYMSCLKHIPGSSSSLECKDRKERIQSADMSLFMWDELLIPSQEFLFLIFKVFLNQVFITQYTERCDVCDLFTYLFTHHPEKTTVLSEPRWNQEEGPKEVSGFFFTECSEKRRKEWRMWVSEQLWSDLKRQVRHVHTLIIYNKDQRSRWKAVTTQQGAYVVRVVLCLMSSQNNRLCNEQKLPVLYLKSPQDFTGYKNRVKLMTQVDQSCAIFWGWKDWCQRGMFLWSARSSTVGDGQSVSVRTVVPVPVEDAQ